MYGTWFINFNKKASLKIISIIVREDVKLTFCIIYIQILCIHVILAQDVKIIRSSDNSFRNSTYSVLPIISANQLVVSKDQHFSNAIQQIFKARC